MIVGLVVGFVVLLGGGWLWQRHRKWHRPLAIDVTSEKRRAELVDLQRRQQERR
jgi:hypothetical protein